MVSNNNRRTAGYLIVMLACTVALAACGTTAEVKPGAWIEDPFAVEAKVAEHLDCSEFIMGVGASPFLNDRMIALARRNAEAQGRAVIGSSIEATISDVVKNFAEYTEGGTGADMEMLIRNVTKQLTEALKLRGAKAVMYYKHEGESNIYALVGLCATLEQIESGMLAGVEKSQRDEIGDDFKARVHREAAAAQERMTNRSGSSR